VNKEEFRESEKGAGLLNWIGPKSGKGAWEKKIMSLFKRGVGSKNSGIQADTCEFRSILTEGKRGGRTRG